MTRKFYPLDPEIQSHIKLERAKARELKSTSWWKNQISKGVCHWCEKKYSSKELTMDHRIPLARGGRTAKDNVVVSCLPCNQERGLESPLDDLFEKLEKERSSTKPGDSKDD